jgi:Rapamycin-insensitive companion of mTOR, N-term
MLLPNSYSPRLTPHTRSLQRDNKHAKEKEQALKLIRAIIEISTTNRDGSIATNRIGTVHLSEAVMRAVVAVAEHPEDPFRPICIETLTEIRQCTSTLQKTRALIFRSII